MPKKEVKTIQERLAAIALDQGLQGRYFIQKDLEQISKEVSELEKALKEAYSKGYETAKKELEKLEKDK